MTPDHAAGLLDGNEPGRTLAAFFFTIDELEGLPFISRSDTASDFGTPDCYPRPLRNAIATSTPADV